MISENWSSSASGLFKSSAILLSFNKTERREASVGWAVKTGLTRKFAKAVSKVA